jgi:hypothetical protein
MTHEHRGEGFSFVALRLRLSSGFALHKGIGFCTSMRKERAGAKKNTISGPKYAVLLLAEAGL